MTVTQRRLRAVFLWAFVSAGIMLLVAFAVLVSTTAQISRAIAQDYPGICPVTVGAFIATVESSRGEVAALSSLQTYLYFNAAYGYTYSEHWPVSFVAYWPDGTALLGSIAPDWTICLAEAPTLRARHERGMSAAMGQPA